MAVAVTMYTDPWCPFSWAAEPQWRRLQVEFAGKVDITYVMGAGGGDLSDPSAIAARWLEASHRGAAPVDPRGLLSAPPASLQAAGIAVRAYGELADPAPYLRRLREAIFLERRAPDRPEVLLELAAGLAGAPDRRSLEIGFGSHGVLEAYGADLERSSGRELPVLAVGSRESGDAADWREIVLGAGGSPGATWPLGVEEAVRRFAPVSAAEVAELCDLPGPRAAAELWRLALEWRVRPRRVLAAEVWEPA